MRKRLALLQILVMSFASLQFCEKPKPSDVQAILAEEILSGKNLYNDKRLKELSEDSLNYLINLVYAKNGKIFSNPIYAKEFSTAPWYKPLGQKVDQNIKGTDLTNLEKLSSIRVELQLEKYASEKNPEYSGALSEFERPFVGIWQRSPVMGSGWTDSYAFFPSRILIERPNQMDCEGRMYYRIGHWLIKEKMLIISWFAAAHLAGGHFEQAHGSCGGRRELIGAIAKSTRLNRPETIAYAVEEPRLIPDLGQLETSINELKYYQSRKDPNDY